jgi:hypothetical protein
MSLSNGREGRSLDCVHPLIPLWALWVSNP